MVRNSNRSLRQIINAALFGALTALGALITIPMQPIPFSLQTFFTSLSGTLLGGYAGALSQVVYLLLGIIGLPVFAGGKAGIGTLFGPTGGFLIGFIVGAFVIGKIAEARPQGGFFWTLMALVAGNIVIYLFGVIQLSVVANLTLVKALLIGVVPFIIGDIIKIAAADWLSVKLRKYIKL